MPFWRDMRVVIDATPLLVRSAGVKNYLYHWIEHLRRVAGSRADIGTFPAMREFRALTHETSVAGPLRTWSGLGGLALGSYTPLPVFDWAARRADVFHASVLVRQPPRRPRVTATIHDMTAMMMPQLHPWANQEAEKRFAKLARKADGLIAVSECTRQDAIRVLDLDPARITTIHSGIAESFFDFTAESVEEVRLRYGLMRPFVLFVGTIEPRKNVDLLLDAFEALPVSTREQFQLVIAGPLGWAPDRTAARVRAARYLGYVPEKDLAPLTAAAYAFVYPSLYEGFGFPVAQAMAAGTPVITSNVSSLPEIVGDAGLLVDPRSQSELRAAMARLLGNDHLRDWLSAMGRDRAREFRWDVCAAKSLEFFRNVAGK